MSLLKRKVKKWFLSSLLILVLGLPLYQLMGMLDQRKDPQEATRLLYQVSLFQYELLQSHVRAASLTTDTTQLELLQQSAYSVQYTHQRLSLAMDGELTELKGVDEMMEYILRLQIGGSRMLDQEELTIFDQAAPIVQEAYEAYKSLLTQRSELVTSSHRALQQADVSLYELFHQKLLE